MENNERMTAPIAPAATDAGQSYNPLIGNSIPQSEPDIKDEDPAMTEEEFDRLVMKEIEESERNMMNPYFLPTVSMTELYERIYTGKTPIIDGLLYRGTYLFAGAPKLGKSFLMMQLAYHVSTGTPLWGFPVQQGDVLYLSLEDDYARLQERLYRMFGTETSDHLHLSVNAHSLSNGLLEQLSLYLANHPNTSLVIIDTLQKVRELCNDTYNYANDYQLIALLKQFADRCGICLMLVHHTRKQHADDSFDMVSGTNGLTGAADGTFILSKEKRTANTAVLEITGRDQPDQKLHLLRNEKQLCWDLERRETELWKAPPDPLLERISQVIHPAHPEFSGSPTELRDFLGVDMKPNALTQKLNVNASRLFNEYNICYWNKRTHLGRRVGLCLKKQQPA